MKKNTKKQNNTKKNIQLIEVWINAIYLSLDENQKIKVLDMINKWMKENLL